MSLTSSLSNALIGLGVNSRRAELIATNVANADTPGYARRRLATSGPLTGVSSGSPEVNRASDPALRSLRRDAETQTAGASVAESFAGRIDAAIGDPDQSGSLQELLARLDASFTTASSDPSSPVRLANVVQSASDLAAKLNELGDLVTSERQKTEADIGKTVQQLNTDLKAVAQLNADILRTRATGHDPSNLMDQRQLVVDRISVEVPIRELQRENGTIALVSQGGIILLDGRPAEIGFVERSYIQPDMTYPDALNGLTVRGVDAGTGDAGDGLAGGRLGALFKVRDEASITAMARLDAFATDLASRFQDPAVDPTLAGGAAGLFVDGSAILDVSDTVGISSRIAVNPLVDASDPGTLWRVRDGLGATAPVVDYGSAQLMRFGAAMRGVQTPAISGLGTDPADLNGLGARLRSSFSFDRVNADDALSRSQARSDALIDLRDGGAVDVDEEMRRLIEVEQAYAANARLVQAVSQMMDRLTEI